MLVLFLLLLVVASAAPVYALDFNANWDYRQSGGEGLETLSLFRQNYNLGAESSATYGPSHAISASGTLSYTSSRGGGTGRLRGQDQLVPAGRLSLVNDIFRAQIAGSTGIATTTSGRANRNSSWSASLSNSWELPFWPNLSLSYSESAVFGNTATSFFNEPDQRVKTTAFSYDWDLVLAQLAYRFSHNESEISGSDVRPESDSHFARIQTKGTALDGKFGYRLSHQFQKTTRKLVGGDSENSVNFTTLPGAVTANITDPALLAEPLPGGTWTDAEIDNADARTEEEKQEANQELQDEEFDVTALQVSNGDRGHFAFRGLEPGIDALNLVLAPVHEEQTEQLSTLEWDLYVRGAFGEWELSEESIPAVINPRSILLTVDQEFESEIMVVAVNDSGVRLRFTEVQALSTFTPDNSSSSYQTHAGFNYRVFEDLNATGNLTLEHSESGFSESDRRGVSGNLRWSPVPLFSPSMAFSEQREEQTDAPVKISRSYSLSLPMKPLPTLTATFGATYNERYIDDLKTNNSTRYSAVFRGPIYPDLTGSWSFAYSESESADEEGDITERSAFSSRLDLQARLYSMLVADLVTNYNQSDGNRGSSATLSLRYRPSELLAMRGAYTRALLGEDSYKFLAGMNLRLLVTQRARLSMIANHRHDSRNSSQNLALVGNWDITKHFGMRARGNYTISEISTYSFRVGLGFSW